MRQRNRESGIAKVEKMARKRKHVGHPAAGGLKRTWIQATAVLVEES
jgi:hypothetical protein